MEEFGLHILKLNIVAVCIILFVKVLGIFLKERWTAKWKYVVWLTVAVSLLVPVKMPEHMEVVQVKVGIGTEREAAAYKQESRPSGIVEAGTEGNGASTDTGKRSIAEVISDWNKRGIFLAVWLLVALLRLVLEGISYYVSLRSLLRMSIPVSRPEVYRVYQQVCREKSIARPPVLMQNAELSTPLLAGVCKSRLFLPCEKYTETELKLIFHHELSHYVHKDLWYKLMLRLCVSVYWFNPFLLIMQKEADKDIENLCDARVLSACDKKEHKVYRYLLLRTVAFQNRVPYVAAGLNDSVMVFKDRIRYMVKLKSLKAGALPGILLAVLLVSVNTVLAFDMNEKRTTPEAVTDTAEQKGGELVEMQASERDASQMVNMVAGARGNTLQSTDTGNLQEVSADEIVTVQETEENGDEMYHTTTPEENQSSGSGMDDAEAYPENTGEDDTVTYPEDTGESEGNTEDPEAGYEEDSGSQTENGDGGTLSEAGYEISDPYDLYSWDSGTNSYIPFQQAEGDASPIGRGSGWYYYDQESGTYQPW